MPFEHQLRRSAGERNSQHANRLRLLEAGPILEKHDLFSIWSQPRQHRLFFAADQQLRRGLPRGLPENVEATIAVGAEDYLLAVGCPGPGQILSFIEGQEPRRLQFASVAFDSGNIDVRLPALFHVGEPLSINRAAEVLDSP